MKRIARHFKTIAEAEEFQEDLYEQYESVTLVRSPLCEEDGMYVWEVRG